MSKFKLFAKFWLPVVLWAALIVTASGDKKSVHRSSRIIEPLVRWLIPDISDEAMSTTVLVVRKGAHVTEFAIFALLLWHGSRATIYKPHTGWSRKAALFAFAGAVLFAVTDEVHQCFVPGRQGAALDVLIDSTGAAGGLLCLWLAGCWRKKW